MEERNFLENLIHKTSSCLAKIIDFHEIELGDYIKNKNSLRYKILTSEKIFFLLISCTSIALLNILDFLNIISIFVYSFSAIMTFKLDNKIGNYLNYYNYAEYKKKKKILQVYKQELELIFSNFDYIYNSENYSNLRLDYNKLKSKITRFQKIFDEKSSKFNIISEKYKTIIEFIIAITAGFVVHIITSEIYDIGFINPFIIFKFVAIIGLPLTMILIRNRFWSRRLGDYHINFVIFKADERLHDYLKILRINLQNNEKALNYILKNKYYEILTNLNSLKFKIICPINNHEITVESDLHLNKNFIKCEDCNSFFVIKNSIINVFQANISYICFNCGYSESITVNSTERHIKFKCERCGFNYIQEIDIIDLLGVLLTLKMRQKELFIFFNERNRYLFFDESFSSTEQKILKKIVLRGDTTELLKISANSLKKNLKDFIKKFEKK